MEKLCLLLVASTLWIVPSPAAPPLGGPSSKGGIRVDGVIEWTTIEINGTLDDDGGLRPHIPEFGAWIGHSVTADGKWFGLDFGTNKELEEKAKKLTGKRILVTGKVEERDLNGLIKQRIKVVVASQLEAAVQELNGVGADSVQETVHLEVQGDLESIILGGLPPRTDWIVKADGKTYHLEFDSAIPKEKPGTFEGKKVVVTGTLKDGFTIHVTGLRDPVLR
jgi:hypothetical protein